MSEAAPSLPDLDLDRLQASLPDLYIGPGDHIRITTYLTGLLDRGWLPTRSADYGPHISLLLARDEVEQKAIHAFYADEDVPAPVAKIREVAPLEVDNPVENRVKRGRRRVLIILAFVSISNLATILALQEDIINLINPVPAETIVQIEEKLDDNPEIVASEPAEEIAETVAFAVTGQGLLRALLALFPLLVTARLMIRLANQQATIDPKASVGPVEAEEKGIPGPDHTGLLSSPVLTAAMGRLRLRREQLSHRLDPERTAEQAARTAGHAVNLAYKVEAHSVAHLVLIDRRNQTDHVGALGDLVLERLGQAGLEVQGYDFLADLSRLIRCRAPVTEDARIRYAANLSDEHRGDVVLIVAEADRVLDRFGRNLSNWITTYGSPRSLALMTPRPQAHWGRAERKLIELGVAVFPISAQGVADYVTYRVSSFSERPIAPPEPSQERPVWSIPEAIEAMNEAEHDASLQDEAIFALQAALTPRAFSLLSVLCIFPVLRPELTFRMRKLLYGSGFGATDVVAELAVLPYFRAGRLPFWLRVALVANLPEERADAARKVIETFQSETGDALTTERTLAVARKPDRIRQFLGTLGGEAPQQIASDAIFTCFMNSEDVGKLNIEARGALGETLRREMLVKQLAYLLLGSIGTFAMWFIAPTLISGADAGLNLLYQSFGPEMFGLNLGGQTRTYIVFAIFLFIALAERPLPRLSSFRLGRAPAILLCLFLIVCDLALAFSDGPFVVFFLGMATFDFFLLTLAAKKRSSLPFDPVRYARERTALQLMALFFCVIVGNFVSYGIFDSLSRYSWLEAQLFALIYVLMLVLTVHIQTPAERTWKTRLAAAGPAILLVFQLSFLSLNILYASLVLSEIPGFVSSNAMIYAFLLSIFLLPILFNNRLIEARQWIGAAFGALALQWVLTNFDEFLNLQSDLTLSSNLQAIQTSTSLFVIAFMPGFSIALISGLTLRRYINVPAVFGRLVAFGTVLLIGYFALNAITATNAQTVIDEVVGQEVDQKQEQLQQQQQLNQPQQQIQAEPTLQQTQQQQLDIRPEPIIIEEPVVVEELGFGEALSPLILSQIVGVTLAYIAFIIAFAHLLWLRRSQGTVPMDRKWPSGPVTALYLAPLILLLGIRVDVLDGVGFGSYVLAPLVAAYLAHRFQFWGLVAFVMAAICWSIQIDFDLGFVQWGTSIDLLLVSLIFARLFADPGFFTRHIALDTITRGQYTLIGLFLLLPEFSYPFGSMQIALHYEEFITFGAFLIGLTRVSLWGPILLFLSMSVIRFVLTLLLPGSFDPFLGFGSITAMEINAGILTMLLGRILHNLAVYGEPAPDHGAQMFSPVPEIVARFINFVISMPVLYILLTAELARLSIQIGETRFWTNQDQGYFVAFLIGFLYVVKPSPPYVIAQAAFFVFAMFGSAVVLGQIWNPGAFSILGLDIQAQFGAWNIAEPIFMFGLLCLGYMTAKHSHNLRQPVLSNLSLWVPQKEKFDDGFHAL